MISFGYEHNALNQFRYVMNRGMLYFFTGSMPTIVPSDLATRKPEWANAYNDCIGFMEVNASPVNAVDTKVQFLKTANEDQDRTTKGWYGSTDGNAYCIPDEIDISDNTIRTIYEAYHVSLISYVRRKEIPNGVSYDDSSNPFKMIWKYDTPITVNVFDMFKTNSNYLGIDLEYKNSSGVWTNILTDVTTGNHTFSAVTASEFRLNGKGITRNIAYQVRFALGTTGSKPVDSAKHLLTHALWVPYIPSFRESWAGKEGDVPAMLIEVGKVGEDKPLQLIENNISKGDELAIASFVIDFEKLADDTI